MSTYKHGDWKCAGCGEHCFASRSNCRVCGSAKPGAGAKGKAGDWNCSCGELNFARRDTCRKCNKSRAVAAPERANPKPQAGDWVCVCKEMNFGTRDLCRTCGRPKNEDVITRAEGSPNGMCGICSTQPANTAVLTCGHLSMCGSCALNNKKCPVCRADYTPANLQRIFVAV